MADNLPGPRSAQFNQQLGLQLLGIAENFFSNILNQGNRIGGHDVPLYDTRLQREDVFRTAGYDDNVATALSLASSLAEPGPGELRMLGDLAPALAAVPDFFRLLQRNPEITGTFDDAGAFIQRRGAEMQLVTKPDGSVEVSYLRRGDEPGTGSELKQVVRDAAQQEAVDLTAINAPFGPGNLAENMRINAERLRREGYVQLPDGTWILRARGR